MRRVLNGSARLILGLATTAILAAAALVFLLPRAVHGHALTVLTGSMTPTIPPGSMVIDRPVDPRTVHQGDIITFAVPAQDGGTGLVTHRVVAIKLIRDASGTLQRSFTTKGDANNATDVRPVLAKDVRGRVWFHVPHLGEIRDSLHTGTGVSKLAMLLLAGYALYQGAAALRPRREPKLADGAAEVPLDLELEHLQPQFMLLMHLRLDAFGGVEPQLIARAFGATLVESNDDSLTLLAAHADRARDALELIDALEGPAASQPIADVRLNDAEADASIERADRTLELPFEPDWNPLVQAHLGVLVAV